MNTTDETNLCRIDAMQHCVGAALLANDCGFICALFCRRPSGIVAI
jgi:hypothetical protein